MRAQTVNVKESTGRVLSCTIFKAGGKKLLAKGHIGTQVGLLAEALGMQVVFFDVETKLALGNARPMPSLAALLAHADNYGAAGRDHKERALCRSQRPT